MADTATLRLTQTASQDNHHTIELEWLDAGPRQTATATVELALTEQDQRDLAWYIEEYAEYPFEPHPQRAARIEARMRTLGIELFNALFSSNTRTLRLWAKVAEHLDDLRVEIVTDAEGATALPWELLRDPETDTVLALHAKAFVRAAPEVPRQALTLEPQPVIRILLVICRPAGGDDVPFRSVATRLIKGLSAEARAVFQLDVLRPPTFAQLAMVLSDAKAHGQPYHVVHFDGHGVYGLPDTLPVDIAKLKYRIAGPQGFVLFETDDPTNPHKLVHGSQLGDLLVQNDVPLLVLNACRSAHAAQSADEDETEATVSEQPAVDEGDPYAKVRAFGSLAQQVMLTGVGGVVAMRYNVYVVTAAQFVAELYRALVQGRTLGEAVSRGRKDLHAQPVREVVQKLTLQDWLVPVVYEAQATQVFRPQPAARGLAISIKRAEATPARGDLDADLPQTPDVGFFGRDETLLALDRGFDHHHAVLLHAYAGSGKTTTVGEFARWYALTGGVDGPVLFSSFAQRTTLIQLLDQFGHLFQPLLQQNHIQWDAITDIGQKRDLSLQIFKQVPVLWVWDNVEPVAGFPTGTPSAWTADEQRELADFLHDTRGTKAKFLLTSRRDEYRWLGDLPLRVTLPPMPMHERWQLAEALAARYGAALPQSEWRPLLVYSQGNPMTLTIVMRQALRDKLYTATQIRAYVERLRAGEAVFDDDENEGRSKSLGASLNYGFEAAFSEQERAVLALLYHFQGFVQEGTLRLMIDTMYPDRTKHSQSQAMVLLDRAAEAGLLTSYGNGYYSIHPALPWFFRQLYESFYLTDPSTHFLAEEETATTSTLAIDEGKGKWAAHAYGVAMSTMSNYYLNKYIAGDRGIITLLHAEEANVLHARRLALQYSWYSAIIGTMQGLYQLYDHTGRRVEWRALVEEIVPYFVNSTSDEPLPGREAEWSLVTQYRVLLLKEDRQWSLAAQLQGLRLDFNRQQAMPLLLLPPEQLDSDQRHILRSLVVSLHELGEIQREQGKETCVKNYRESYELAMRINDRSGAAIAALNLGNSHKDIPALRNLAQAEAWYQCSLELHGDQDRLGRSHVLGQLGYLTWERFKEARQIGQPMVVLLEYLNTALRIYQEALDMTPPDAINEKAVYYIQLGAIYSEVLPAYLEQSVANLREAIRYFEQANDLYYAAVARENIAIAYMQVRRLDDALLFAQAALRNFEQFEQAAAQEAARTREIITEIKRLMRVASQ